MHVHVSMCVWTSVIRFLYNYILLMSQHYCVHAALKFILHLFLSIHGIHNYNCVYLYSSTIYFCDNGDYNN